MDQQDINITWELTCHRCKSNFEVPAPRGPREEREMKCPVCGSEYIERIETLAQEEPSCGG